MQVLLGEHFRPAFVHAIYAELLLMTVHGRFGDVRHGHELHVVTPH